MYFLCQLFKPHGGVNEIAQDELGRFWFTIDEQGDGLVQKRLRKGWVVLYARCHGLFRSPGWWRVHFPFWVAALLRLQSSHRATAWSMSSVLALLDTASDQNDDL